MHYLDFIYQTSRFYLSFFNIFRKVQSCYLRYVILLLYKTSVYTFYLNAMGRSLPKPVVANGPNILLCVEGNGGLYRALSDRGILQNMKSKGIQYVHIYGVDNVLIRMADPAFIGFCIMKAADCAVKVVEKIDPNEPIGVVGMVDGKFRVNFSETCVVEVV